MLHESKRAITISTGYSLRVFTRDQIAQAASEILHDGSEHGIQYWVVRSDRVGVLVDTTRGGRYSCSPASIMANEQAGGIRWDGPTWKFVVMSGDWTNMAYARHTLEAYSELTQETRDFAHRLHKRLIHGPRNLGALLSFLIQVARRQRSFKVVQEEIPVINLTPEQSEAMKPIIDMLKEHGEL